MKTVLVREIIDEYLNKRLSRRGFFTRMASWGFSVAAAASILDTLTPLVEAESLSAADTASSGATVVQGTGGKLLVEQLRAAGVRFIFNCCSSGSYPIFDALVDRPDLQVIQVPQEGQMVSIAQGYALASGQVAFTLNDSVGFPNTLNNMYNAWRDRTPLVIGSQREPMKLHGGRDAAQEWDDFLSPSASFTRWRWSVDDASRIPEITRRAFKIASTPPEGPVALAFPDDVLAAGNLKGTIVDRDKFILKPSVKATPALLEEAAKLLIEARSPVILVGPEVTRSQGNAEVIKLAEQLSIPVAQTERLFDDFPTNHPLFLGQNTIAVPAAYSTDFDLVLNLGARMFPEDATIPSGAKVVHIGIDPNDIGRVIPTDVGIVADVKEAAADLTVAIEGMATKARLEQIRSARIAAIKGQMEKLRADRAATARAGWDASPLSWNRIAGELSQLLEKDAIIVPEITQDYWLSYHFVFEPGGMSKIGRTTGSALGWGVGAAIGVKLANPNRQVVALQGDGGFLFGQADSLWTMARYEVPVIVVVFNNRSYEGPRNKILSQQGRQAQTRKDMTCYLGDPDVDFARVAAGFGVKGEVVESVDQVRAAIQRAIDSTRNGKPYLIDALVGRTGLGAASTWYPKYSVAAARSKKV
jgi:benzoylformate decarboxylase